MPEGAEAATERNWELSAQVSTVSVSGQWLPSPTVSLHHASPELVLLLREGLRAKT